MDDTLIVCFGLIRFRECYRHVRSVQTQSIRRDVIRRSEVLSALPAINATRLPPACRIAALSCVCCYGGECEEAKRRLKTVHQSHSD